MLTSSDFIRGCNGLHWLGTVFLVFLLLSGLLACSEEKGSVYTSWEVSARASSAKEACMSDLLESIGPWGFFSISLWDWDISA